MQKKHVITLVIVIAIIVIAILFFMDNAVGLPSGDNSQRPPFADTSIERQPVATTSNKTEITEPITLTAEERDRVTGEAERQMHDEAAYILASTTIYTVWYSGIDDSFRIVLIDAVPTQNHRAQAEAIIAKVLEINVSDVCLYKIDVEVNNSPFVPDDELIAPCP